MAERNLTFRDLTQGINSESLKIPNPLRVPDNQFHELHDTSDDCDEEDECEIAEIHALYETVRTENLGLEQIVGRNGNAEHEGNGETESERCLHVLTNGKERTHTEEECEDHVVHEDGPEE